MRRTTSFLTTAVTKYTDYNVMEEMKMWFEHKLQVAAQAEGVEYVI